MRRSSSRSELPTGGGKPIQTYGEGRDCIVCGTRLSRYNSDRVCGIHRGWSDGSPTARSSNDR